MRRGGAGRRQAHTEAAFLIGFAPGRGGDALRVGEGARGAGESSCPPRRRMTAADGSNGPVSRCGVPRDPARRPVAETSAPDAAGDSTASASAQTRPHCLNSSVVRGILGARARILHGPRRRRRRNGREKAPRSRPRPPEPVARHALLDDAANTSSSQQVHHQTSRTSGTAECNAHVVRGPKCTNWSLEAADIAL